MEDDDDEVVVLPVKMTKAERRAIDVAATEAKLSRHAWMKLFLNAASGYSTVPRQMLRVLEVQIEKPVRDGEWE